MNDSIQSRSSSDLRESEIVLTERILKALIQQVEQTKEGIYTCEETFDLLDEYAELINSNQEAARLMPLVKAHLDICAGCTQRYEILLKILNANLDEETLL